MTEDFLRERAMYSERRLAELREGVAVRVSDVALDGLTIFAAGSFARSEAGEHSDIDLFFTYHPSGKSLSSRRTNELKLFGRLIDLVAELGFQEFSNDSQYLQTHDVDDVLLHLGGPVDDAENHFTLRMLLLLESKCVFGDEPYDAALRKIIDSYYRDFPGNEESFQPWFLINDIMRYWKTLLLNYENNRNRGDDEQAKIARRVKNFKLRFSRMTTCFATIAALASYPSTPSQEDVYQLALLTPQERLGKVRSSRSETESVIDELLVEYEWFLQQTSLTKEELHAKFVEREDRRAMYLRAEAYGTRMFDLLSRLDETRGSAPRLLRYLVV